MNGERLLSHLVKARKVMANFTPNPLHRMLAEGRSPFDALGVMDQLVEPGFTKAVSPTLEDFLSQANQDPELMSGAGGRSGGAGASGAEVMPPPGPASNDSVQREGSPNTSTYIVQPGDTLWSIARRLYGNPLLYTQVAEANSLSNPDLIRPGQRLTIPERGDNG